MHISVDVSTATLVVTTGAHLLKTNYFVSKQNVRFSNDLFYAKTLPFFRNVRSFSAKNPSLFSAKNISILDLSNH